MADAKAAAVITVSYGDGREQLRRQAEALADDDIAEWIIVANGNAALLDGCTCGLAHPARLVTLDRNLGSGAGFAAGLAAAFATPATGFALLLDQDNLPSQLALARLRLAYAEEAAASRPTAGLAIAAYRPRHHRLQALGRDLRRPDSCIGFHIADLPAKLRDRVWPRPVGQSRVPIPTTAFGGLFIDRAAYGRAGSPRDDFVLYGDDTEYTLRLTRAGTRIVLDPAIVVTDMDEEPQRRAGLVAFTRWITDREGFRLYYGARNEAWLDRFRFMRSPATYHLNRAVVRTILRLSARSPAQRARLALFLAAACDGEANRLGAHPLYPLQEPSQ